MYDELFIPLFDRLYQERPEKQRKYAPSLEEARHARHAANLSTIPALKGRKVEGKPDEAETGFEFPKTVEDGECKTCPLGVDTFISTTLIFTHLILLINIPSSIREGSPGQRQNSQNTSKEQQLASLDLDNHCLPACLGHFGRPAPVAVDSDSQVPRDYKVKYEDSWSVVAYLSWDIFIPCYIPNVFSVCLKSFRE